MGDGVAQDCFIWEDQAWTVTNSDNSGEKSGHRKLPGSSTSDSPPPSSGRKRSRASDNGGGGGDGGKANEAKSGGGGGVESDHEVHIWTERERRKKMRNMFSNLHALLPQLPPKADKSTIVDEAVNYIKTLQQTLQKLQKRKLEMLHGFNYNPSSSIFGSQKLNCNAELTTREAFLADHQGSSGGLASFICSSSAADTRLPAQPPAFQTWTSPNVILNVCGDDAQISLCCPRKPGLLPAICFVLEKHKIEVVSAQVSSDHHRTMYMVQAHASRPCEDLFSEMSVSVEEMYKQAAGEIMLWITNQY